MKIIKCMNSLGLVLIFLMSTNVASAEGDSYWAVAQGVVQVKNSLGSAPQYYGAAWNFPSRGEAENAAMEACRKKRPPGCNTITSGKKLMLLYHQGGQLL